jgi:hypothetical protein
MRYPIAALTALALTAAMLSSALPPPAIAEGTATPERTTIRRLPASSRTAISASPPAFQPPDLRGMGVRDRAYTSPHYGYTLRWDATWTVHSASISMPRPGALGRDQLVLGNGPSLVTITGTEEFGDHAMRCVAGVADQLKRHGGIANFRPATTDGRRPLAGGTARDAFAVYTYDRPGPDGRTEAIANYVQCRSLVPGKAALVIVQDVRAADFNAQLPARGKLLASLTLPPTGAAAPGTPGATPAAAHESGL